jgi:predicted transcriptional regulator
MIADLKAIESPITAPAGNLTAPRYSARRSTMAKEIGFGVSGAAAPPWNRARRQPSGP